MEKVTLSRHKKEYTVRPVSLCFFNPIWTQFLVTTSIGFYLQSFSNPHVSQSKHILMGTRLFG